MFFLQIGVRNDFLMYAPTAATLLIEAVVGAQLSIFLLEKT
jgi:hypothetical protein